MRSQRQQFASAVALCTVTLTMGCHGPTSVDDRSGHQAVPSGTAATASGVGQLDQGLEPNPTAEPEVVASEPVSAIASSRDGHLEPAQLQGLTTDALQTQLEQAATAAGPAAPVCPVTVVAVVLDHANDAEHEVTLWVTGGLGAVCEIEFRRYRVHLVRRSTGWVATAVTR